MENEIIKVSNLKKTFKKQVVFENWNCSINRGSFTTIFGPSGSGKSTLLNIIGTLESFDAGNVSLFNKTIPKIESRDAQRLRRKKIGYLFQSFGLIEDQSIKKNLDISLAYSKISRRRRTELEEQALEQVGLSMRLNHLIYGLSGGEQQRVALAQLLLKPSELILADEPTGSLDKNNRNLVARQLLNLKEKGKTIVVVTHDDFFKTISDKIINLK